MVNYTEADYKRPITHTQYRHGDKKTKKGGLSQMLEKRITHNTRKMDSFELEGKNGLKFINDVFYVGPYAANVLPVFLGGAFLLLFLFSMFLILSPSDEKVGLFMILATLFFFLGFSFFAIYYYTMPKKELIYNREDGKVTFPGFMWYKNITMSIDKVLFSMSSPSMQGGGAYNLQIVRPDRIYSLFLTSTGRICYEDLSFILWYMDKNRPLPPGTAFDPYRDKDFKRRKAAGFPKPLFESDFPTPEATQEQQKERELIGGW